MTRLALPALGLLVVALCSVIAFECLHRSGKEAPPLVSAKSSFHAPAIGVANDDRQVRGWVTTILARPIFEPSRRPPAAAHGLNAAAAFPRLTGIIITPQRRAAIFAVPGAKHLIMVTTGSRLNGVLIKSIEDNAVVVVDAGGTRTLHPSFDKSTGNTPAAPPARPIVDLPSASPTQGKSPFASIRGLSGRPLGLAAHPNPPPSSDGPPPSLPAPAATGGSP